MPKYRVTLRSEKTYIIDAERWVEEDYFINFIHRNGVDFDSVAAFTKSDIQSIVKI